VPEPAEPSAAELSYPRFPSRLFVLAGALVAVLIATAFALQDNRSRPHVHACAVAAERVMVTRNYSAEVMGLIGPDPIAACHGLSSGQYAQALADTYRIEYGRFLSRVPLSHEVPPPAFKSLSAQSAAKSR
jgi:hypothetical protein